MKVLSGNRITIPKYMREKIGIEASDFVILRLEKDHINITPAEIKPKKGRANP
ncbi:hypothetical protein ES706_03722 [subsurface metagenome]